jgi:hypothetical protein
MATLALDPGGTKANTGYFFFEDAWNWEIGTIKGKSAVEHGKNLDIYLKNKRPQNLVWESGVQLKMKWVQKDYRELLRFNGIINYLRSINNVAYGQEILNTEVLKVLDYELDKVKGLEVRDKKWYFKDKSISNHERDAILVFFVYWTIKLRRPWPWQ